MQVRDWMTHPAISIKPQAMVWDALQLMVGGNFRRLPVLENGDLVGIITQGDIQNRIFLSMLPTASPDIPPALKSSVEAIMSRQVVTVTADTEITEAAVKMLSHNIGGLPVLEGDAVVGMITVRDLFNALIELEKQTRQHAVHLEEEVRARTRHLEILNNAIRAATRSLETEQVFTDITSVIRELFPFDRSSVLLLNDAGDAFVLYELYVNAPVDVRSGDRVPREGTLSGWVVDRNQPTYVEDLSTQTSRFPNSELHTLRGMGSAIVLPLAAHGTVFGTLNFASKAVKAFSQLDFDLAQQVSYQVAQALNNVRQYQRVNELLAQLREADRVRNEFMGIVTHDLRSPLASIYGYIQLFQAQKLGPLPDKYMGFTNNICDIIQYMLRLVEDLLAVGQLGARALKIHPETVAVPPFVQELVAGLETQALARQVSLGATCPDGVYVLADPARLRQLLTNLIVNGIKFNRADGRVSVDVTVEETMICFDVSDTGVGIAQHDLTNIFELFTRASTEKSMDGTGLGLFIARQLADLHGGSIRVHSTPDVGSTFSLRLPKATSTPIASTTATLEAQRQ
ncbi:MAG TPA: CBS domain-containing protein [Candidatus Xenobia bacterium]|jgi:signal transduction histidine kinase/predicted transcriptional regulator